MAAVEQQDDARNGSPRTAGTEPKDHCAGLAQMVEQLPCKHQVGGSTPPAGTTLITNAKFLASNGPAVQTNWTFITISAGALGAARQNP